MTHVSLDDSTHFLKILSLEVPWAHTSASTTPGKTDRERRENFRAAALNEIKAAPPNVLWWAFRITVKKAGRPLDVDNVAKTVIDSFCTGQIVKDGSRYLQLGLYPDDHLGYVRVLQVTATPSEAESSTRIEIFACVRETCAL